MPSTNCIGREVSNACVCAHVCEHACRHTGTHKHRERKHNGARHHGTERRASNCRLSLRREVAIFSASGLSLEAFAKVFDWMLHHSACKAAGIRNATAVAC